MSQQLIAAYAVPEQIESRYFLVLEQEGIKNDAATVGEVAGLLDTLYDRDPCEEEPTGGEEPPVDEDGNIEPPVTEDEYWQIVRGELDFSICDEAGCDILRLRVYRSHLEEPYKLIFDNGTQQQLTTHDDHKKEVLTVKSSRYVDTKYPVHSSLKYKFSSCRNEAGATISAPTVTADGARLVFPRTITAVLRCEYDTSYDLVLIKVPRDDKGQPGECHVTALYAGDINELDLEPAEIDESMDSVAYKLACGGGGGHIIVPEKPYSCYERVYHQILCRCSKKESGRSFVTEEDVSCPEFWGDDISPGRHLVGSRTVLNDYVSCGEEDDNRTDNFRDICCHGGVAPDCDKSYSVIRGGKAPDIEALRAEYGNNITLIPVGPKNGVCGTWTIIYKRPNKNCCDEIEPLKPYSNNPINISPNGTAVLETVDGNLADEDEWIWTASGGLTFSNGLDMIVGGKVQRVYAPETLCNSNIVRVDDLCTTISMRLDNTDLSEFEIPDADRMVAPGATIAISCIGGVSPYYWSAGDNLTLISPQGLASALFEADEEFCGTETVTVTDGCTEIAQCGVRSSAGNWVYNGDAYGFCTFPGPGILTNYRVTGNGYRYLVAVTHNEPCGTGWCADGFYIASGTTDLPGQAPYTLRTPEEYCHDIIGGEYSNGCCTTHYATYDRHYAVYQYAYYHQKWECYA